ncbi:MAG: hypothetical protein P4L50_20220 [Anaerolineaceae bacterium]|nr:hypothetical protein [Anaerolineaceae bacterium]
MDSYLTQINIAKPHTELLKCLNIGVANTWDLIAKNLMKTSWNNATTVAKSLQHLTIAPITTLSYMRNCTSDKTLQNIVLILRQKSRDRP